MDERTILWYHTIIRLQKIRRVLTESFTDRIMKKKFPFPLSIENIVVLLFVTVGLYFTSYHDFLLFHSLTEIFSIVIAFGIFIVAWNSRHIQNNHYLLFLGISYLFVGCIDLAHTLTYKGMMVFHEQDANTPTQLWIIARYTESLSLLIAPLFLVRPLNPVRTLLLYFVVTAVLLWSAFTDIFPTCYQEGVGLTPFKITSEYIICGIMIGAFYMLWRRKDLFSPGIFNLLIASIVMTIASELAFTFYIGVYDISNIIGHFLKFISFYLIYKALVETGLREPYELLFLDLKESERKYRSLFANMLNGFAYHRIILDSDGVPVDYVFLEVNEAFEKMTGLRREDVIGQRVTEVIPGIRDSEFDWIGEYGKIALNGTGFHTEEYAPALNRWYSLSAYSPQKGYFAVVFEDISRRKQIENALRESEEKFKLIANSIKDVIWMSSSGGETIMYANPAYEQIWGRSTSELERGEISFGDDIHPEDRQRVQESFAGHPLDKWEDEYRIIRPDGEVRWIENSSNPIFDREGNIYLRVGVARDITERKQAELEKEEYLKQLSLLMKELERSNEELQQFASIISHDLQEPLRTVSGFVQLLKHRYQPQLDGKAEMYINAITDGTIHMHELLNDLLAFARVGGGELDFQPVDLQSVLDRVLQSLGSKIAENKAEVNISSLPTVVADEMQMFQLFQNLMANALKFRGEENPTLDVTAEQIDNEWIVCVRDNGIGIDPEYASRIFLVFQRLHRRDEYEGTGIGLAICQKIIERHRGRIWVESAPYKGSSFYFSLPVNDNM